MGLRPSTKPIPQNNKNNNRIADAPQKIYTAYTIPLPPSACGTCLPYLTLPYLPHTYIHGRDCAPYNYSTTEIEQNRTNLEQKIELIASLEEKRIGREGNEGKRR